MTHEQTNVQERDYVGCREGTKVVGQNQGKKLSSAHLRPKKTMIVFLLSYYFQLSRCHLETQVLNPTRQYTYKPVKIQGGGRFCPTDELISSRLVFFVQVAPVTEAPAAEATLAVRPIIQLLSKTKRPPLILRVRPIALPFRLFWPH